MQAEVLDKILSLQVKCNKEPSIAQVKEVLLRNYSEKDEESLEILCVKYEGRSAELEQYLEKHFKDIPTKLEVKQANARADLEAELQSFLAGAQAVLSMPWKPRLRTNADLHTSRIPAHCALHASPANRIPSSVACDERND